MRDISIFIFNLQVLEYNNYYIASACAYKLRAYENFVCIYHVIE